MTIPFMALLAFALWTLCLVALGVGPVRLLALRRGELQMREIRADIPHGTERYQRLMRAHLNCVENLPVFATLVLIAHLTGLRSSLLDALCAVLVVARIGQSTAHIVSARARAVYVRFSMFVVQLLCMFGIAALLLVHAATHR